MSFARLHALVAYLLAGLGLVAVCLGPEVELGAELVIALAFFGSLFAHGPRIHDPRWARAWTLGLFAFLGLQVLRGVLGAPPLALVLELTAALQISRLFNRRGAREHQQIGAIALLHLIAATVLSSELSYAFVFLGFVIVTPWALALAHLRAEIEAEAADRLDVGDDDEAERRRRLDRVLASKELVGTSFLASTAALVVPLFLGTGLLFVTFPRVGLGFLSFGRDLGHAVSGFGVNVELGDFGVIRTDATVVLRVTPPNLPREPPLERSIRMRGTSFDHYDGHRWTRSRALRGRTVPRYDAHYPVPVRLADPARDARWDVVLDPLEEPVIFFPPDAVGLSIEPRVESGRDVGRDVYVAPGMDVRYGDADGLALRYAVWTGDPIGRLSAPLGRHAPQTPHLRRLATRAARAPLAVVDRRRDIEPLEPELARRYLEVPAGHERVAALAAHWTAGAADDEERVARLVAELRDSGRFAYSLETPRLRGRLPLDVFLFEARRGHCEYYSTALAVMLRTQGVPARNVTGFLGGRFNDYGRYYAIRQGDAHSWVEAWLPERGWVTLDPTPAARDAIGPEPGWGAPLRELLDAMRTRWAEDVVAFDMRRQVELFRSLRRFARERTADPPGDSSPGARRDARSVSPLVVGALALGLGLLAFMVWRRRRAHTEDAPPDVASAIELYRALDAALAKIGWGRPADRTPREQVEALASGGFDGDLDTVREVTARYVEARYGAVPIDAADHERLRAAVRALATRGRSSP